MPGQIQFPDSLEEWLVEVEPGEFELRPVGRSLQELLARRESQLPTKFAIPTGGHLRHSARKEMP